MTTDAERYEDQEKALATPDEMQAREVRSIPDPTAKVTAEQDNGADPTRLQPPSFGAKPGASALDFAVDEEDEEEFDPYDAALELHYLRIMTMATMSVAAMALGLVIGVLIGIALTS